MTNARHTSRPLNARLAGLISLILVSTVLLAVRAVLARRETVPGRLRAREVPAQTKNGLGR